MTALKLYLDGSARVKVTERGLCAGLCAQQGHQGSQSYQVHVILWGLQKKKPGLTQKLDSLPLAHLLSLIVRFKVNPQRLAVVHQVKNQNAHLRYDDPLIL